MALTKGVNSYVTEVEATVYFGDRLDVAAWTVADAASREQALISATDILENISWVGIAVSATQALAFPRVGSYFDPRIGALTHLGEDVPARILQATKELAYHLLNNDGLLDDTGGVKNIKVGPIELSNVLSPSVLPKKVKSLINPIRINAGSNPWWRAN